ncbi:hypothetical protein Tco_1516014 [Tanacetum coccineum]
MASGKLRDRNVEESWALLEDLTLYDNESWNDPRDFAKPVKGISLPQDVPSTSNRRLIELENQVQRLMEAHLAPMQPTQVNKITSSCEICSGPHDTQYCMETPEQAFVEYASSCADEAGGPNKDDKGIEWLNVEEPLDLVDTSEESVYELNMSYVMDFTILENIETNIEPSLSHAIFGRPFVEIACLAINRKHGLMNFTDGTKEITFKTPYKEPERSELSSEGHALLSSRIILTEDDYDRGCRKPSDLEDGFYRDTIKLEPQYLTGMDDEGEVTKAYLLEDKKIPSVGVFDEVFSTWMTFIGNTRDLGSFGEETDKIMDPHQISLRLMHIVRGDGVAGIKQHRRDLYGDGVRNLATTSGRVRLKEDLESSTWRRR